jgi:hypothetical protein
MQTHCNCWSTIATVYESVYPASRYGVQIEERIVPSSAREFIQKSAAITSGPHCMRLARNYVHAWQLPFALC